MLDEDRDDEDIIYRRSQSSLVSIHSLNEVISEMNDNKKFSYAQDNLHVKSLSW